MTTSDELEDMGYAPPLLTHGAWWTASTVHVVYASTGSGCY